MSEAEETNPNPWNHFSPEHGHHPFSLDRGQVQIVFYIVGHREVCFITLLPPLREEAESWLMPTPLLAFRPPPLSMHTSLQTLK